MKHNRGFTLIELNLAMIFVSLLLIATVTMSIFAGRQYQKGIALKTVNQSGRLLMEQIRRDINMANPDSIKVKYYTPSGIQLKAYICLGTVSYVFNLAPVLYNPPQRIVYQEDSVPVYVARVNDNSQTQCGATPSPVYRSQSSELLNNLGGAAVPVAVHRVSFDLMYKINDGDTGATQALYQLAITIGTNEKDTTLNGSCKPPSDNESNFDYCSVREFKTIMRTRGEV